MFQHYISECTLRLDIAIGGFTTGPEIQVLDYL